ncbi:hypothetical protein [Arenimonas sp.]|uniref:hypothetical protein n=1 Tax=Arenimonas sp. TaxID=1872635 RepID=UPI0039E5BF77
MKLHSGLTINGKKYKAGDEVSGWSVYPFFLMHMGIFGASGFFMAYGANGVELFFLYLHGGIAILAYVVFYLTIFGGEEVKWMFINAALGLFGIYAEINYILSWFGKALSDFPPTVHVTPFLYYILYTFLLRQALLDATGSRENSHRRRKVEIAYVIGSVLLYGALYLAQR